jgi:hypothetical protein
MEALASTHPITFEQTRLFVRSDEAITRALAQVAQLDFSMLKHKLVTEQGWTPEYCSEVEDLYRKFLALNIRYPGQTICPTGPIDEFWHAHILDTRAYAADCERLFGGMLHHFPYFGLRGPDDRQALEEAFAKSLELFIVHFGIDPTAGDARARSCRPQSCP